MSVWQHLSVSPIAGALGAEVGGIQLAHLNVSAFAEIQAAFLEYQVLFFGDQELTRDQQRALARRFRTLNILPFEQPLKDDGYPEFVVFQSGRHYLYVAQAWHADLTFLPEPPLGSLLRARTTASWRHHVDEHVCGL